MGIWGLKNSIGQPEVADINPIEYLLDELECRLRTRPQRPTAKNKLFAVLLEEWRSILESTYRKLVESMSRRVKVVIAAKGGPTTNS